jgi:hypothetical protein
VLVLPAKVPALILILNVLIGMVLLRNQKFLYYGYFGLVVGYFAYYYLYAGNWDYYFPGLAHQENQLATLLKPGFYISGNLIAIPKLLLYLSL